jgi:hypothetical protein
LRTIFWIGRNHESHEIRDDDGKVGWEGRWDDDVCALLLHDTLRFGVEMRGIRGNIGADSQLSTTGSRVRSNYGM